jgi:predicted O-methyltransferase YrrM
LVYRLATEVLTFISADFSDLSQVEKLRSQLVKDQRIINSNDLGAGRSKPVKKIKHIARKASSSASKCKTIFALAHDINPSIILELGTSLGIGTLTMSLAAKNARVISIEGDNQLANIARENFSQIQANNIEVHVGSFDDILPTIVEKLDSSFLAFIDGNHRFRPTVNYFNLLMSKADCASCIIVDDIHWSEDMEKAWNEICSHPKSTISIDLFHLGIVYYRENTLKQKFWLRL